MIEVEHAELPLEVGSVIPLNDRVFNHADAAQIAVDLHDSIRVLVMAILVVI